MFLISLNLNMNEIIWAVSTPTMLQAHSDLITFFSPLWWKRCGFNNRPLIVVPMTALEVRKKHTIEQGLYVLRDADSWDVRLKRYVPWLSNQGTRIKERLKWSLNYKMPFLKCFFFPHSGLSRNISLSVNCSCRTEQYLTPLKKEKKHYITSTDSKGDSLLLSGRNFDSRAHPDASIDRAREELGGKMRLWKLPDY